MRVLALDTTTLTGSVALVVDDRLVYERGGDPSRPHVERLPRDLVDVASAGGLTLADIDVFAVASGPGSFTGMRIGIAAIKGAAFVHNRAVVGVSALEAMAQIASIDLAPGALIGAWMDAHRHEVFAALYRVADASLFDPDRLAELEPPTAGDPASTVARWTAEWRLPEMFIGDGAALYRDRIATRVVDTPLLAAAIGRLAAARTRRGEAAIAAALHPLYVRRPDVEIARDKKAP